MGKLLVILGVILIAVVLLAFVAWATRRWRDKQLLKHNPMALEKRGLDRIALLELTDRQQEIANLRESHRDIAGLLAQALSDEVVTMWGTDARAAVERAHQAAQKYTKE